MAEREQTYKSHTRFLPLFHFFVLPVLIANLVTQDGESNWFEGVQLLSLYAGSRWCSRARPPGW